MFPSFFSVSPMNMYIDAFQGVKRSITNAVIEDEVLNRAANDFINAQSDFAKMLSRNTFTIAKYYVETTTKFWFPQTKEKVTKEASK
jgi:hypothetical protein